MREVNSKFETRDYRGCDETEMRQFNLHESFNNSQVGTNRQDNMDILFSDAGLQEEVRNRFARVSSPKVKKILNSIVLDAKREIYQSSMQRKLKVVQEIKGKVPIKILISPKSKSKRELPNEEIIKYYNLFMKRKKSNNHASNKIFSKTTKAGHEPSIDNLDQDSKNNWNYNSTKKKVDCNLKLFSLNCHIEKNKNIFLTPRHNTMSRSATSGLKLRINTESTRKSENDSIRNTILKGIIKMDSIKETPEYKNRLHEMNMNIGRRCVQ